MEQDLTAPDLQSSMAAVRDDPIGCAKLTPLRAPFAAAEPDALELQQLKFGPNGTGPASQRR